MAAMKRLLLKASPLSSSAINWLKRCISTAAVSETAKSPSYPLGYLPPRSDPKLRNVQWVFLGCPGVGKGISASRLSSLLAVPHIATGDLVREELSSNGPLSHQLSSGRPTRAPSATSLSSLAKPSAAPTTTPPTTCLTSSIRLELYFSVTALHSSGLSGHREKSLARIGYEQYVPFSLPSCTASPRRGQSSNPTLHAHQPSQTNPSSLDLFADMPHQQPAATLD
ncbi:hypothetical protein CsSME_00038654 [Camellia sinensis var. sinensis]